MSDQNVSEGEARARRLEAILAQFEAVAGEPAVAARLNNAPGEKEWNALQILGHVIEMVPFWLHHIQAVSQASGEPLAFGRTLDSPERLEGVEHGAHSSLTSLMDELRHIVKEGAATIRGFSQAELDKLGAHNRMGDITVKAALDSLILEHGEAHVQQVKTALGI